MGLDYSFITVIHKKQKDRLIEYIRKNGTIDYGDCACIHFEMDSFILKYLEGGYSWAPHYDKSEVDFFIEPNGKARIGGIDISTRELEGNPDEIEVSLTAVTSDMSLLFRDSVSITRWFVEMSREINSIITYIDLEDDGVRIIYFNDSEVNLELKSNHHLGNLQGNFFDIIKAFYVRYEHFKE